MSPIAHPPFAVPHARIASLSSRPATYAWLTIMALVYLWFWTVAVHRIDDAPAIGVAHVFQTACGDFEHFYLAARAMREGGDLYASGAHGYIYPPLIAFLFMPLTFAPVKTAALLMLAVNMTLVLLCTWVAAAEVMRRFEIGASFDKLVLLMAATTLLSATRLRGELQMWQTDVLLMTAMLLALRFLDTRPHLAGLLLGLAVNIKYLPLVFLPYLLLRRRFVASAWFVAGIVAFALAPALRTGWNANLHHWATASSGLARLIGFGTFAAASANIDPITAGYSISVTSGVARIVGNPAAAWLVTALVALALALVLRIIYGAKGRRVISWPPAPSQQNQPHLGTVALEWAALVALLLAFGPQTNPRHTSLLLIVFSPLAAMVCFPASGASRRCALLAAGILFLGLALPPKMPAFVQQAAWWAGVGGAGWCMVLMLPFLFMAGFSHLDAPGAGQAPPGDQASPSPGRTALALQLRPAAAESVAPAPR